MIRDSVDMFVTSQIGKSIDADGDGPPTTGAKMGLPAEDGEARVGRDTVAGRTMSQSPSPAY
jgi:hypothetical protein